MIDTHAHLNDIKLLPKVEEILQDADLEAVMVVGYDEKSSKTALKLAESYDKVYAVVGCHPNDADSFDEAQSEYYKEVSTHPKVVAIGEIGLDYYHYRTTREAQKAVFEAQILLAHEVGLPIVLHVRDAYQDTLQILKKHEDKLNNGVLVHCYSGSRELVREFSRFDAYFALGGAITYKGAKKEEIIRAIPLDRIVLETDAPYLTPTPKRGEINQPKYMVYTLNKVSEVLGFSAKEIEDITTKNAKRFFNI